jgi:sugar lactone lactonase YvrE
LQQVVAINRIPYRTVFVLAASVVVLAAACGGSRSTRTAGPGPGTEATHVTLSGPEGLAVDANGNLYVSEFNGSRVVRISPGGQLSVVAGTGRAGYSGDNGPATQARLSQPTGLAVDSHGSLAIADYANNTVREVDSNGRIKTLLGPGSSSLDHPIGLAFRGSDLYIADTGGSRVLMLPSAGSLDVTALGVHPTYLAVSGDRALYMSSATDNRVSQIDISESSQKGVISLVAGTGAAGYGGDRGAATSAQLNAPYGVATDGHGNVYVSDRQNNRVRKVDSDGVITTFAGTGVAGFGGDGGPSTAAKLNSPVGLAMDSAGNLFIADGGNGRVRRVDTSGVITTVAGSGVVSAAAGHGGPSPGGQATKTALAGPEALALDSQGNLYVSEFAGARVVRISPAGRVTNVAGTGTSGYSGDGKRATAAQLSEPTGVALDDYGDLAIADYGSDVVRVVNRAGVIRTVRGSVAARLRHPIGVSFDGRSLHVADTGNGRLMLIPPAGTPSVLGRGIRASYLLQAPNGNLYVSDLLTNEVVSIDPKGVRSVVAGSGKAGFSGDGGPAIHARLDTPYGLALDAAGNLYVSDRQNNRVRKIDHAGTITTVAGTGAAGFAGDGGAAARAKLSSPVGLAVDGVGDLYIADGGNGTVRRVDPRGVITTVAGRTP